MDTIQQLRSYRVANIALFDLVSATVGLGLINKKFGTGSFMMGAAAAIPVGIAAHWAFGVDTELNYQLGISNPPKRDGFVRASITGPMHK